MKKYIISEEKLKELIERDNKLLQLEINGVDNWSGYEDYEDDEGISTEDYIEKFFEEVR